MSFEKLGKTELLRAADEDFAVEVDKSWPVKKIIEALNASGVDFGMYLAAHPERKAEFVDIPENIVQGNVTPVAAPVEADNERKILVKMLRANPLYQIGKYRWTNKHPYQLVSEKDADRILIREEGFRQATPSELNDYYS